MKYYAVRIGRNPGIYHTWDECKRETMGFKGASFKKFSSLEDARSEEHTSELQSLAGSRMPSSA